ncbi:DUF3592 domain-containing protein [Streptomyces sp. NPDC050610]|uniref:DUF3592 domain-containing protein n=1 Tax=Streptomyces sp. NPDC050610 TaxID=3157097 RepID=UPI0034369F6A
MTQISSGVVLRGRGAEFRLGSAMVTVVRGRTTWTVPLESISEVVHDSTTVRIRLSGGSAPDAFSLVTRNSTAAHTFTQSLRSALVDVRRVSDGPSRVTTHVRRHAWLRWLDRPGLLKYSLAAMAYLAFAVTALYRAGQEEVVPPVHMVLWLGPIGATLVVKSWRDVFRDAAILRRRGITVPGRVIRYEWVSSEEEHRPIYQFRTVDGRQITARSSVLVRQFFKTPHLDVTYDPEEPQRARGVGRAGGMVRGVFQAFFGSLMALSLALPLFLVLNPLLPG